MKRFNPDLAALLECGQTVKTVASAGTPESLYPGVKQVFTVQAVADSSGSLAGKYFDTIVNDLDAVSRFYFVVSGVGTPPPRPQNGRLTAVPIVTNDSANTVAAAVNTAVDADPDLVSTVSTDTVTVTQAVKGYRAAASAQNSGFTVTVTTAGVSTRKMVPSVSLSGKKARDTDNTGTVYVGFTSANDTQLEAIAAGKTVVLRTIDGALIDIGQIFIDVVTAADGIVATWPAAERGN